MLRHARVGTNSSDAIHRIVSAAHRKFHAPRADECRVEHHRGSENLLRTQGEIHRVGRLEMLIPEATHLDPGLLFPISIHIFNAVGRSSRAMILTQFA